MNARFSRSHFARRLSLSPLDLLVGCGSADAGRDTLQAAPTKPSAETLSLTTHPGYVTLPGVRQECLGRLVFDAPQWRI